MKSNLDMIKTKIEGKIYDVVDLETYQNNMDAYVPSYTAIISQDGKYALPVRNTLSDPRIGIYATNLVSREVIYDDCDMSQYELSRAINLSDSRSIGELLEKQDAVRNIEHEILTDVNNIFTPRISEHDTPAIKILKDAVIKKHIDLDKYEHRFGSNYNNDKRLFNKDKISMQMLVRSCDALDIKATLVLEDKSDNIPNPIGEKLEIELTKGGTIDD